MISHVYEDEIEEENKTLNSPDIIVKNYSSDNDSKVYIL